MRAPPSAPNSSFAFSQRQALVGGTTGEILDGTIGPGDADRVDFVGIAEAEVGARVVARQVTRAGLNQPRELFAAGRYVDDCTVGITFPLRQNGADQKPVSCLGRHVAI